MKKEHLIGVGLVVVYLVFTISIIIHVATCLGVVCKSFIVLPAMPWAAITPAVEELIKANPVISVALVMLNSALLYGIYPVAILIGKYIKRPTKR